MMPDRMLWRPGEHETVTDRPWDAAVVGDAIRTIVTDAEAAEDHGLWPGHPLDDLEADEVVCSLYLGSAGVIWALSKLGSRFDASAALAGALARYRAAADFGAEAHPPSLWMGETGLLVVAETIGAPGADGRRLRELIRENRDHPTWELMWGSPGTMLAARACGLEDEWHQSAELLYARWDQASDVWTQDLYGRIDRYLGPAHGFAGNVHALRGFVDRDLMRERVTRALTRTAGREGGMINWPPVDGPLDEKIRVQWCHGAPGIVATLGDLMPLEMALGGGELIWRAGPLRKGPGLCHGTAGNGFAFLRLYELTGDLRWLERARRFAMHAIKQVRSERADLGRGRYTLWTGHVGVALYLRACLDGVAGVPTIDSF